MIEGAARLAHVLLRGANFFDLYAEACILSLYGGTGTLSAEAPGQEH